LCPHFEECGGCQYQHISLATQRELKRQQVIDALHDIGQLDSSIFGVQPVQGTTHAYGYRDKLTPQVRYDRRARRVAVGFQRKGKTSVLDVEECAIATSSVNTAFVQVRMAVVQRYGELEDGRPTLAPGLAKHNRILKNGENLLLRSAGPEAAFVGTRHADVITQKVCGVYFRYLAGEFFQNNSHVLPLLVGFVLRQAAAAGPSSGSCDYLIDAYCGSGLFALCASRYRRSEGGSEHVQQVEEWRGEVPLAFSRVVGLEISKVAVASARANAERNGIEGVQFIAGDSASLFQGVVAPQSESGSQSLGDQSQSQPFPTDRTAVIIDPPRSGCDEAFLAQLLAFAPRKVVYVSCDVTTQARDAATLTSAVMGSSVAGGRGRSRYCIVDCTPFDLFPQTRHIENVLTFVKTDITGDDEDEDCR